MYLCICNVVMGTMLGSYLLSSEISDDLTGRKQAPFGSSHIYMGVLLNVTMGRYKIQSRAEAPLPSLGNRNWNSISLPKSQEINM